MHICLKMFIHSSSGIFLFIYNKRSNVNLEHFVKDQIVHIFILKLINQVSIEEEEEEFLEEQILELVLEEEEENHIKVE